ncbi:hypothetical protein R5R35_008144 [Gryllus longicercus]|uniref:TATA box-binding protein-associated factor RNA polymerase I subunit B n=1 Tax=Gryllus longicercus TaxID=2509291 RepID=A0AAN9YYP9_9ORTH
MDTGDRHMCPVCGGCDFLKENGFFYCIECQTQCEGIREQVFEDLAGGNDEEEILIGTPFACKKTKNKKKNKQKGEEFTSWELLNFVLVGLTEELISYGAPKSLKDTVLQMWASYLNKLEIAFFSKEESALPKLGVNYRSRDAMNVYGLNQKKKQRKTKRISLLNVSNCADLNSSIADPEDWASQKVQKNIKKKAKKAFMKKVAELSIAECADNESITSSLDQSRVSDLSAVDDALSVSSKTLSADDESFTTPKIQFSQRAMAVLSGETNRVSGGVDLQCVSRTKLVVLLYLALLYEGSTICLSDLLRWIREGHLSFYEAAKHLPENCFVQGRYRQLFRHGNDSPTYEGILNCSILMAQCLEVNDWPLPSSSIIAKKYVTELQLPEMFSELVEQFLVAVPLAYRKEIIKVINKPNINYEATIVAVIVIILKLLFGLDGKTEHQISKAASQLNTLLQMKNDTKTKKLFVWNDWVQQLICRRALLTLYHFPTKHLLCPETYGNPYAYINYCHNWHDDNAGFEEKYNKNDHKTLKVLHPALLNTLTSVLEKLQDSAAVKNYDIQFPRCGTPYSTYIQKIIEKSAQKEIPMIAKPALDVLAQDFMKSDITYLLQPELMVNLASSHGHRLKIKKRSAQKKFKTCPVSKKDRHNEVPVQPVYVSVTECCRIPASRKIMKINAQMRKKRKEKRMLKIKKERNKNQRKLKKNKTNDKKGAKKKKSENVKKCSKKREATKSTFHFCDSSRKRRKEELPSGDAKKIKLCKLFKLYVPCSKYWVFHFEKGYIPEEEFDYLICSKLPLSFGWLLSECSFLSEMSKFEIYKEVVRIEGVCNRMFKRH